MHFGIQCTSGGPSQVRLLKSRERELFLPPRLIPAGDGGWAGGEDAAMAAALAASLREVTNQKQPTDPPSAELHQPEQTHAEAVVMTATPPNGKPVEAELGEFWQLHTGRLRSLHTVTALNITGDSSLTHRNNDRLWRR